MNEEQQVIVHKHYYFRWIVQLVCVVGAIRLMIDGSDGWGWLLFIATML